MGTRRPPTSTWTRTLEVAMSSAIPIRNAPGQSIPLQFHRDSVAHSQGMGGISWGGASVGSWLRDEVLMATRDNNQSQALSGSAISDTPQGTPSGPLNGGLAGMNHESGALAISPDQPAYFPSLEADFCRDYSCCGNLLPTLHDLLRHYEEQHISPSPPEEPPVMRRMQNMEMVNTNDVFLPFEQTAKPPDLLSSMGSLGQSHMGGSTDASQVGNQFSNHLGLGSQTMQPQPFAPPSFQPVHHGLSQLSQIGQAGRGPGGASGAGPAMHAGRSQPVASRGGPATAASAASAKALLGEEDEPCIDDPARQLYMLERSENKPFKCPVIGCEKTYKNQNGLKYHRQHGHQNQTLHLNDDGTYSIIDPLTSTPYPDGMGMEKDKPYRCEICGKRYKNLNGLKYHRAHSTH